jgi:hypothetical protein
MQLFLLSYICLATLALCTPLSPKQPTKVCQDYLLPLNITSLNYKYAYKPLITNEDVADLNFELGRVARPTPFVPVTASTQTTSAMYKISGTLCQPVNGGNGTVLLATHGGGFDRRYACFRLCQ